MYEKAWGFEKVDCIAMVLKDEQPGLDGIIDTDDNNKDLHVAAPYSRACLEHLYSLIKAQRHYPAYRLFYVKNIRHGLLKKL